MAAPFSWKLTRYLFPKVARHVEKLEGALQLAEERQEELEAERDRLLEEAGRLAAMLDATPDFVALSRLDGTLVYMNQGGRRMLGLGDADLSRVKQAALCPPWVYERTANEWLPRALKDGVARDDGAFLARDGREIPVSFVMTVHRNERGEASHLSTVARDLTGERGSSRALRERDELLRRASEASRLILWELDLPSGTVKCSANAEAVWGRREGRLDDFVARVHRDDRDTVHAQVRAMRHGQPEISLEYRVVHPSGAMRWLHSTGVAIADAEGRSPTRFVGVSADVTHRRVADEALRDSERQLQAANAQRAALARELREPLYPLLNAVQLLGLPGQEARLPALRELMQRQVARLEQALDRLAAREAPAAKQASQDAAGSTAKRPEAPRPPQAKRVLVVDDNQDAARSLAMLITSLGADARVAHDGREALELVPTFQPSAVLLDIGMPGMDGCEVARRIRGQHRERQNGRIPLLVALMGRDEDEGRRAEQAGFDRQFFKPADVPALQSLIASLPQ